MKHKVCSNFQMVNKAYIFAAMPAATPEGASSKTRQESELAGGWKRDAAFRNMSG